MFELVQGAAAGSWPAAFALCGASVAIAFTIVGVVYSFLNALR